MRFSLSRRVQGIAIGIAAMTVLYPVKAFTSPNTLSEGRFGEGAGVITGYVVSTVHYDLAPTDAHTIAKVAFTLDEAPESGASIKARLSPSGAWYPCAVSGAEVACDTTSSPATVMDAIELTVVAVQ